MVVVRKQKGESDDKLIARFRKKIITEKLLIELRDRERHKSPSEKRKEKKYAIERSRELEKKRGF